MSQKQAMQLRSLRAIVGHRLFETAVLCLVVLSLILFSIETTSEISASSRYVFWILEAVIVGLFTIEYILRVSVASPKRDYVLSFYGIIDLIAILPFFISIVSAGFIDGRFIRAFRILRIFRLLKLLRYTHALDRLRHAVSAKKEEIIVFVVVSLILIYVSAAGIWFFEREVQPDSFGSVFDGLWWAVATLTTVGYGDVYPVTLGGRIFTFFLLITGLSFVSIPSGIIASGLMGTKD